MYKVSFSPKAAAQYADIVEILSNYPKKLLTFENEIESVFVIGGSEIYNIIMSDHKHFLESIYLIVAF